MAARLRLQLPRNEHGEPPPSDPKQLLEEVVNPELAAFERYFSARAGGGILASYEREIVKAYLWFKLMEDKDGGT